MANLSASVEPWRFEGQLIEALSPNGGVQTLYSLVSRLLSSAIPVIAMDPARPMVQGTGGIWTGMYWSRALATALAVGLAPAVGGRATRAPYLLTWGACCRRARYPSHRERTGTQCPGSAVGTSRPQQRQISGMRCCVCGFRMKVTLAGQAAPEHHDVNRSSGSRRTRDG